MRWDILNLDDDDGWAHFQILDRLLEKNVECMFVDIWTDDNIAILVGCKANDFEIAKALNISERIIYNDEEHAFVILNLFQEKYLRGLLK